MFVSRGFISVGFRNPKKRILESSYAIEHIVHVDLVRWPVGKYGLRRATNWRLYFRSHCGSDFGDLRHLPTKKIRLENGFVKLSEFGF